MKPSFSRQRQVLLAALLSSSMLNVPQAHAFQDIALGTQHFFDCLGLMLGKPDEHAKQCLPNRGGDFPISRGEGGSPYIAPVPPAPVVVPVVEVPAAEEPAVEEPAVEPPPPPLEPEEPEDPPASSPPSGPAEV